jgi:hypothetical protein
VPDLFCQGTYCGFISEEGLPLLRDNGHRSREGSRRVVGYILKGLDTVPGENPLVRRHAAAR